MHLLQSLRISQRLWLMILLSIAGIVVLAGVVLDHAHERMVADRQATATELVQSASGVVTGFHRRARTGELSQAAAQQAALDVLSEMRFGDGNYFWVMDTTPRMLMHPVQPDLEGKPLAQATDARGERFLATLAEGARASGSALVDYHWSEPGSPRPQHKIAYGEHFAPWGWVVASGIYMEDINTAFRQELALVAAVSAILLAVLVALAIAVARSIIGPLRSATAAMEGIASGEADLTQRLPATGRDEIRSLSEAFNRFVARIQETVTEVGRSTGQLAAAGEELSVITRENTESIRAHNGETQQVATAVTEMTATTQDVAGSAESAAASAREADTDAARGKEVMAETAAAIGDLSARLSQAVEVVLALNTETESISTVLDVISSVAEQTNLLALNAAIEAARAGEHGRGFAVVADEVRTLASRTHSSTEEIQSIIHRVQTGAKSAAELVQQSQSTSGTVVERADRAQEALGSIVEAVARIRDMTVQIATAAEEQTAVAQEIDQNVGRSSQFSQQLAERTEQTEQATRDLAALTAQLEQAVHQFRV
jgi:methyl-accepting chemotaxis protein